MTIQKINLGSSPKGEGGDKWREGGNKINDNFNDLDERTTLAQETANSKTANATDAHLLSRSNHTGTQPISTISGLQAALGSAASQINIAGNAATAGKLATPRKINGIDFDGSQDIDTPTFTTNVAGLVPARIGAVTTKYLREDGTWVTPTNTTYTNMSAAEITAGTATTGRLITPKDLKTAVGTYKAATATKLATARNINNIPFDGTADISFGTGATLETNTFAGKQTFAAGAEVSGSFTVDGVGMFGVGQTYKGLFRTKDVTYTNTTGKTIFILVQCGATGKISILIDNVHFSDTLLIPWNYAVAFVPHLSSYKITGDGDYIAHREFS